MENTFSTLLLKTHFILLFYHSPLFTLLEPPIIILGVYIIDTGVDIHTDMPKFTQFFLWLCIIYILMTPENIIMEEAIHVIVQLIPVAALKWELHSDTKLILQKY